MESKKGHAKDTTPRSGAGVRIMRCWRLCARATWSICGTAAATRLRARVASRFFEQTVAALGRLFEVVRVLCDSGFYLIEFIEHLERRCYSYIIAAPLTPPIQRELVRVTRWDAFKDGLEVGEFFFAHADAKWTRPRRYVAVRQQVELRPEAPGKHGQQMMLFEEYEDLGRYRYSVMITNDHDRAPVNIWREYRPRACDENVIKDLKHGLGLDAFNVNSFWATEAILVTIALVCYNLLHYLDTQLLYRNQGAHHANTLRATCFILPGQLGSSAGRYRLRIAVKPGKTRAKLLRVLQEIQRLPHRLDCNAVHPP